jgi:hypothetical protein
MSAVFASPTTLAIALALLLGTGAIRWLLLGEVISR